MSESILITGATGNLGAAVTHQLLSEGYQLNITTLPSDKAPADERIHAKVVDLLNEEECAQYVAEISQNGNQLRAGILLVGGFAMGGFTDTGLSDLDRMIKMNFSTAFVMAKQLFKHFEANGGGKIILIGARPGLSADQGSYAVAYALSKSLIFQLADHINTAGKDKNIQASVVVPSVIDTPLNRQSMPDADFTKWVPAERLAEVISFLLSDAGGMLRDTVVKVYNGA